MNTDYVTSSVTPEENLSRYLREIRSFPMLEVEDEFEYARRWRDHKDHAAAHRIVNSHLRLAAKIAMGFKGYGLPIGELISEGNIGLMQAINKFDPERGFRFSTYAMWWIRASIQEYILHSWSLVKMGTTAAQKKLFFNLRKIKGQIKAIEDGDMTIEQVSQIAQHLNVPETEVINMNRRLASHDHSLNAMISEDSQGEWQDFLEDEKDTQEVVLATNQEIGSKRHLLARALTSLSDRERSILVERRLKEDPSTLEYLSHHFGISRERVRQIEVRAYEKIQKSVRNAVIDQRVAV
ncbi:MAG: RNA polymerase sigma factor RpoH [Rhodospirillales bacterium]|nr:RNA polymerase sigma factor RpoH [Rhodospirillales bacterium]